MQKIFLICKLGIEWNLFNLMKDNHKILQNIIINKEIQKAFLMGSDKKFSSQFNKKKVRISSKEIHWSLFANDIIVYVENLN